MSVQVLDIKTYEQVLNRLFHYCQNSESGINNCEYIRSQTSTMADFQYKEWILSLVRGWYKLNDKSYATKYTEGNATPEVADFINFKNTTKPINSFQCLKFLHCIRYNIELDTIGRGKLSIEEKHEYGELEKIISSIQDSIISSLPQYDSSNWSNPVE